MNLIEKITNVGLFRPKGVTLTITADCNLYCGHCLVLAPKHKAATEFVPLTRLHQLIR